MQSYPFTSRVTYDGQGLPQYDRAVDSAFLRKVFAQYFSDGVFYNPTDALQVVAGTGMQVLVKPGVCHIQGAMGIETEEREFPVPAAEAQPRIDTVVARLDLSLEHRSIDLYYVKGTAAAEPQTPALTRNTTIWELGTANIRVEPGTETVGDEIISDTRLDTGRCGTVAQTIGELDTEPYFQQLEAAIKAHDTAAKQQILLLQQAIDGIEQGSEVMLRAVYDKDADGVVDEAAAVQAYTPSAAQVYAPSPPAGGGAGSSSAASETFDGPVRLSVDEATGAVKLHAVKQSYSEEGAPVGEESIEEVPAANAAKLGGKVEAALSVGNSAKLGGKTLEVSVSGTTGTIDFA